MTATDGPETGAVNASSVAADGGGPSGGAAGAQAEPPAVPVRAPSPVEAWDSPGPRRLNVLVLSFLSFCLIGFGTWIVSAGKRYREEYAQDMTGWRVGGTRMVELTLVRDDKRNLGCASDQTIVGLHCAYRSDGQQAASASPDDPQVLQPYNTIGNEFLLGAGLWTALDLKKPLPGARFTVVCNYHVAGVLRSATVRFDAAAAFTPVGRTVTAGSLTDCVLPQ